MAGQRATAADARIGARIAAARRVAGFTQRQVAEVIGVSGAQLQKYEKGSNRIAASSLMTLATMLGLPIAGFFHDEPAERAA